MQKSFLVVVLLSLVLFIGIIQMNKNHPQSNFTTVCAKHILVDTEYEANSILQDIRNNNISFEEAARKFSKCPSGEKGGDLGVFRRGVMVKEFEDVAFSTDVGEISAPVQTQFGWHLIKVSDKK